MKQGRSKLLSMLVAAAVLVSSTVVMAGAEGEEAAKKTRYPVPDFDFSAEEVFMENSTDKKPRWASWSNAGDRPARDTESCYFGKSAKLTDNSQVHDLWVDLYDDYALPAGDYILQAFAKTNITKTDGEGATDQGLRLYALSWNTEDTALQTIDPTYSKNLSGVTEGWEMMEFPFTVAEGVQTVRIGAKMNNSTGTANVTRFTIRPAENYYTVKNGGFEEFGDNFATEFVRDAGPANAVDNEKWGAWTNYDFTTGERTWDTLVTLANVGHTGEHSLCIDMDVFERVINLKYGSLVKLDPEKDYEVSAWVKTEDVVRKNVDGTDMGAYIHLAFFHDATTELKWPQPEPDWKTPNALCGDNDWTQIKFRFTPPEGADRVQIMPSMVNATGKVYFDDIEIKEAEALPSEPIVEDPDFEKTTSFVRNNTPAGADGDAIRYAWGAWYGKSTDGSAVEQPFGEAFTISDTAPSGWLKSAKITAQAGTNYQIRQIIENLDGQMEYVLRAQVKTENLTGEGATVGVAFMTEDKNVIWESNGKEVISKAATGSNDWADLFVKFTMPEGATDLFLYGQVRDSAGTAYFTNFELLPANFYDDGSGNEDNDNDDDNDGDDNDNSGNGGNGDNADENKDEDNAKTSVGAFPAAVATFLFVSAGSVVLFMRKRTNR